MAPTIFSSSFQLEDWGVDLRWRATPNPPGAWTVSASIQLPAAHPVLPGRLFDYEICTTRKLVSGPASRASIEAALRSRFALPCHDRHWCVRGCREMANLPRPKKVAKALRTLLRCALNGLIFQLDLNETLDLHLLFGPGERHREPLLSHLSSRPGLLPLVGKMLENDVAVRERFGLRLERDIAATADQGRLGKDRMRSFVHFCQTRMRYLVHDTRRFFLARKTGATFFLTHYVTARAHQQLMERGSPSAGTPALDRALSRAQEIGRRASLEACIGFHHSLKEAEDFRRRRWVCRHCVPGQVVLDEDDAASASKLQEDLGQGGRLSAAKVLQLKRTSLRQTYHRTCMITPGGQPLAGFVRQYFQARGLNPAQVERALTSVCVTHRQEDGAPCELINGFHADQDTRQAVTTFVLELLSRRRLHQGSQQLERILSCIYAETRNTACSRRTRCKLYIFRDIQYSRLGPSFLHQVRRCFLLPEDLMWYFWFNWAMDPARQPLRTGTRFVGDCKKELDHRLRRGLLGKEHGDTLKAQLFSYFPDELGLVPLWHLREALPGCEQVLGQRLEGMDSPWNELTRAGCWELLMKHKGGPRVPDKGVTSFEELMQYQPLQVSLDELADKGIQLAGEAQGGEKKG